MPIRRSFRYGSCAVALETDDRERIHLSMKAVPVEAPIAGQL